MIFVKVVDTISLVKKNKVFDFRWHLDNEGPWPKNKSSKGRRKIIQEQENLVQKIFNHCWLRDLQNERETSSQDISAYARTAIDPILDKYKVVIESKNLNYNTIIEDHIWSLSHTKNKTFFTLIPLDDFPELQSIGVDIEYSQRKIPDIVKKNFSNSKDVDCPEILLWGIKEAAYKAISKVVGFNFDLKNIIVTEDSFCIDLDSTLQGRYFYKIENDYQMVVAYI